MTSASMVTVRDRLIVEMLATFTEGIPRCDMERDAIAYGRNHTTHQLRQYLLRLTCDGDPGEHLRKNALAVGHPTGNGRMGRLSAGAGVDGADPVVPAATCARHDGVIGVLGVRRPRAGG